MELVHEKAKSISLYVGPTDDYDNLEEYYDDQNNKRKSAMEGNDITSGGIGDVVHLDVMTVPSTCRCECPNFFHKAGDLPDRNQDTSNAVCQLLFHFFQSAHITWHLYDCLIFLNLSTHKYRMLANKLTYLLVRT